MSKYVLKQTEPAVVSQVLSEVAQNNKFYDLETTLFNI